MSPSLDARVAVVFDEPHAAWAVANTMPMNASSGTCFDRPRSHANSAAPTNVMPRASR